MAMIAACTMDPGVYFGMNIKGGADRDGGEDHRSGFSWSTV